jgi:hypothetical protein
MTEQDAQRRFQKISPERLGEFGERVWSNIFRASGIPYIPLHKIETGHAPMIQGKDKTVLPDYECALKREAVYVDSKAKTKSVFYRKLRQERHGIDRRSWVQYIKAAALTDKKCGIALIELFRHDLTWSGSFLIETLNNLGEPIPGTSNQRHMVYWPRKRFVDLDSWSALELLEIWQGKREAAYPVELTGVFTFTPTVQTTMFP